MPQAPKELQDLWEDDAAAFVQLGSNFAVTCGGIISPRSGYSPTSMDYSAIDYLIQEWDYMFSLAVPGNTERVPK